VTRPTRTPDSSSTSRRTASSRLSPASTNPASAENICAGQPGSASEQTLVAAHDDRDRDRIRAREVLGLAVEAHAVRAAEHAARVSAARAQWR
jgi:hypothetical protein